MLFLPVIALAVAVGWLSGGRLDALADVRIRRPWLVLAAFALQVALFSQTAERLKPALSDWLPLLIHGGSYALALAFIAANRHLRGWSLMALGTGANALAVLANGGHMPVAAQALVAAGRTARLAAIRASGATYYNSVLAGEGTRFAWLGDWLATPAGTPFSTVFSPGDVILAAGIVIAVAGAMEGRRPVRSEARFGPAAWNHAPRSLRSAKRGETT